VILVRRKRRAAVVAMRLAKAGAGDRHPVVRRGSRSRARCESLQDEQSRAERRDERASKKTAA
jgi:hypothetical protein